MLDLPEPGPGAGFVAMPNEATAIPDSSRAYQGAPHTRTQNPQKHTYTHARARARKSG
jgi:hypothetical protein